MLIEIKINNWLIWIIVCAVIMFILWLFIGNRAKYPFIGISPLMGKSLDLPSPVKIIPTPTPRLELKSPLVATPKLMLKSPHNSIPQLPLKTSKFMGIDSTPELPFKVENNTKESFKPKKKMDSRGENICRGVLEKIYNKPFPKIRPGFIRNPETGTLLELDGYNSELGIAFEYNGLQHYKWPNFTNQTYNEFIGQVKRDQYKVECCDKHNVYLITVPYNVPFEKIEEFIKYYLPENVLKRMNNQQ